MTGRSPSPGRGRARDPEIDVRIMAAASRHLARHGYEALSLAAVAEEAGTTRQALYRRWPTKATLAMAALATAVDASPGAPADVVTQSRSASPAGPAGLLGELVGELASFQRGVSAPGRLSLVGAMLQEGTAPDLRAGYRAQVVAPRRARIRGILERAREAGHVDADADLDVAVTLCTGSWYARELAGDGPPADWAGRTARLVWRAVGGALL